MRLSKVKRFSLSSEQSTQTSLFDEAEAGARASAIHYSLIETAKTNGLEPLQYYQHILTALPYADTVDKVEDLLPWNVELIKTPVS